MKNTTNTFKHSERNETLFCNVVYNYFFFFLQSGFPEKKECFDFYTQLRALQHETLGM